MLLIAIWAGILLLSPLLSFVYDKLRKVKDSDAKISTGYSDIRHSNIQIFIWSLPLLIVGVTIYLIDYYFI